MARDERPQRQLSFDFRQVSLPYFDGPLDLLLHLVRKQQLDINELRLAELTEPYLAYVEQMQEINLDQASDFLAIAATLVWLKSRSLLPREGTEEDELDPETVEEMLLLRLREYQRFKDATVELTGRELLGRDVFPRQAPGETETAADVGPPVEEASIFSLLEAFRAVLKRSAGVRELHIIPDEGKVEEKIDQVLGLLEQRQALYFDEFFESTSDRAQVILTFIAVLELVRVKAVRISQSTALGPLHCRVTEAFAERGEDYKAMIMESITGGLRRAVPGQEPGAE